MVAECSSAETGVGPAIAEGSQVWNGSCADLPSAPTSRSHGDQPSRRLSSIGGDAGRDQRVEPHRPGFEKQQQQRGEQEGVGELG
jgi:hypothetical protein